jgi:hypothetical protein
MSQVAAVDVIRTLAFGSISGAYAAVGTPVAFATRLICFTNKTAGDMFFSDDGVNNKFFVPAGAFKLIDVFSNRAAPEDLLVFPVNTQWYVKQSTAPVSGAVYIEIIYGQP